MKHTVVNSKDKLFGIERFVTSVKPGISENTAYSSRTPYWLATDKLANKTFVAMERQKFTSQPIGIDDSQAKVYTAVLPGFSTVESNSFALAMDRLSNSFMNRLQSETGATAFAELLEDAVKAIGSRDFPRFKPSPVNAGNRLWEFRPIIDQNLADEKARSSIIQALNGDRILRFTYP